jgi:hypothetical protein
MEPQNYININLSNERFISLLNNRIEENNHIINNYLFPARQSVLHQEILLPVFIKQEVVIPEDAVCGISFEPPNCRTSCNHYFCCDAITTWLEKQKNECKKMLCPMCRTEITSIKVNV